MATSEKQTLHYQCKELKKAIKEFNNVIVKELHIIEIADFLEKKLKKGD